MARVTGEVAEFHVRCSEGGIEVDTNCGISREVSRDLVWLRWFNIGQSNIRTGLSIQQLRVLEVFEEYFSDREEEHGNRPLEKLWVDSEVPVQLRHLLISQWKKFQGFPESIGCLSHLKKIVVTDSSSVYSLPDEFCFLRSLEHLTLIISKLRSLPINFGNLTSLRHLDLSASRLLRGLPASFKNLILLQHLNLSLCTELTLKSEEELNCLQNVTKLEYLNLEGCERLEELPRHIANNVSLTQLRLGCPLRELPRNIGELSELREMLIKDVLLTSLPTSFRRLISLTNLHIINSPKLKCRPDSLGDLFSLTNLYIEDCPKLECLPHSLGDPFSLRNLKIINCPELKFLPNSLRDLSSLTSLKIIYCTT